MSRALTHYESFRHASALETKRIDLFDAPGGGDGYGEDNVLLASCKIPKCSVTRLIISFIFIC